MEILKYAPLNSIFIFFEHLGMLSLQLFYNNAARSKIFDVHLGAHIWI